MQVWAAQALREKVFWRLRSERLRVPEGGLGSRTDMTRERFPGLWEVAAEERRGRRLCRKRIRE